MKLKHENYARDNTIHEKQYLFCISSMILWMNGKLLFQTVIYEW